MIAKMRPKVKRLFLSLVSSETRPSVGEIKKYKKICQVPLTNSLSHAFIYSDESEEIDEETAVERISEEIDELNEKRDELLIQKGDLGIQEANIQTLLKLTNAIMKIPSKVKTALKTGTDNEVVEGEKVDPAACYDLADFYERTDRITQWGPVKAFDDDLTKRFVDKIVVQQGGIEVEFKAGIAVKAPA